MTKQATDGNDRSDDEHRDYDHVDDDVGEHRRDAIVDGTRQLGRGEELGDHEAGRRHEHPEFGRDHRGRRYQGDGGRWRCQELDAEEELHGEHDVPQRSKDRQLVAR